MLVVSVLVGCDDMENVILESIGLQRATAAPNQPRLNEATSFV